MGKLVENICLERNIEIIAKIDKTEDLKSFLEKNSKFCLKENISLEEFYKDIVCIDFSLSEVFLQNIKLIAENKINTVCGTTGWDANIQEIKEIVEKNNIGFLYGSNFSIGVNLFFKIVSFASKLINNYETFDVMINEVHHKNKIDWPSGTAITIANLILENFTRKNKILSDIPHKKLENNELFISSTRGGDIFGEHTVIFDDIQNQIQIKHIAKDKKSFASGAIDIAMWLTGKKGFFTLKDYL